MSDAPTTGSIVRARLTVGCGPRARALAGRLVMSLGAETTLPLDRVQEAAIVAETLAERCGDVTPDRTLELAVRAEPGRLELRAGPLAAGAGQRMLVMDAHLGAGGVLRGLSSSAVVRRGRDGTETLVLTVLSHPGPAALSVG